MATRLTDDQRAKIDAVCERMRAQAMSTEPLDQARCLAAVARAYEAQNLAVPSIEFHVSPVAAMTRLMACAPEGASKAAPAAPDLTALLGGDMSSVFNMLSSALPSTWPMLGDEVDTACAHDFRNYQESLPWDRKVASLVERRVNHSNLEAFGSAGEAVRESLGERVVSDGANWLLYTAAHQTFWKEVVQQAVLEATLELGNAPALPPTVAASRELMPLSPSIYTFEKLCLVCERPEKLEVEMNPKETFAHITWRDGTRSEHQFEYDADEEEGDDEE